MSAYVTKFSVCPLTNDALLLKMYCQRDGASGNSSAHPTPHPSLPMHSHSTIFTLAFSLSPHTESQDCFRLYPSPLSHFLSYSSLPPSRSLFPPSCSLCPCCSRHIAVANARTHIGLLPASKPTNHRLTHFKNTEQDQKGKNKALIDGNKRHQLGLNSTVI